MILVKRDSDLSIRTQCEYLGIPRYFYYNKPQGESKENLKIMKLMDEHILDEPTVGVLTMQSMLKDLEILASYERVRSLMRKANIQAIYSRRHLSILGVNKYIPISYAI